MTEIVVPAEKGEHHIDGYDVTVEEHDLVKDARQNSGLYVANSFERRGESDEVDVVYNKAFHRDEIDELRESDEWRLVEFFGRDDQAVVRIRPIE